MDAGGHLRMAHEDEMGTMENMGHPVETEADLPPEKLALFRQVEQAGNRQARKKAAKKIGVDWQEYQIYRRFLVAQ